MKKNSIALFILFLAASPLSSSLMIKPLIVSGTISASAESDAKPSLPSPFIIAGIIIGLVALFGGLLSLYFARHHLKQSMNAGITERFWAIDSADFGKLPAKKE